MNLRFSFLILFLSCCLSCSDSGHRNVDRPAADSPSDELLKKDIHCVFYNVENLFDTEDDPKTADNDFTPKGKYKWDEGRYIKKLSKLEEAISLEGIPGVIGLSEVENENVINDLLSQGKLREVDYRIVHEESRDTRGIDVALAYDAGLMQYVSHTIHKIDKFYKNKIKGRDILHVTFLTADEEEIHFFVNHWPSRRKGILETQEKRNSAAKVLNEVIDAILEKDPDSRIMIMGDFNDEPTDFSMVSILKAECEGSGNKLYNLSCADDIKERGTLVYNREWLMFDQILISKELDSGKLQASEFEIYDHQKLLFKYKNGNTKPDQTFGGTDYYGGYSDHLPVSTVLRWE